MQTIVRLAYSHYYSHMQDQPIAAVCLLASTWQEASNRFHIGLLGPVAVLLPVVFKFNDDDRGTK